MPTFLSRELHKTRLPASAFPEPADEYFCDNCQRNLTKHFYRLQSHSGPAIGPERYWCQCGRGYLTGAAEWDHLSARRKKQDFVFSLGCSVILGAILFVPGLIVYFALHRSSAILALALTVAAAPLVFIAIPFWVEVIASIRRTRFGGKAGPT